jgi:hypothetical protein
MNPLEREVIGKQMAMTLAELNKHFCDNNSITKKEFMDLQVSCWREVKRDLNVTLSGEKE